ncbi:PmbA/TldD family protein [Methanosarcina mazei]|jgi:TldD protein|nr:MULTISPECIES: TldD/PmbA family protein [Methanosarcina]KKG01806.1 PmbA/TldD family protein [Methanosarcina mazei]KKG06169.1 PmbA/TldD family protein [Methanosarcina mazei]KKG55852.1 PmbA/TldD family protein [Methanosarcina mazei]KKG58737.1 PmbA/TldD family protein [Methanosarcina mazei]KKG63502.1 PmbA/TldD family protein [Methanosarcina mazei]
MQDIKFYDCRVIEGSSTSIVLDNGKIEEISRNFTKGAGIRALCGGSWGYTAVEGDINLKRGVDTASKLAFSMNASTPKEDVELAAVDSPEVRDLPEVRTNPRDIAIEEKVSLLKSIEEHAKLEGVHSTKVMYLESEFKVDYRNSEGLECEYELLNVGFAVSAVASENGVYQAGRESRFGYGYELFENENVLELAGKAGKTALELLKAKTPKGGEMPVVLDQELAGVFAHEAVGHASEADLVLEGDSILENRIGEQIASPLINIIDDPTLHEFGYYPFDAEGSESKRTEIIKDGIFNSYLHSRETAAKLGGTPGNCRAQGYSMPVVRMSNTFIDNGDSRFEEMLEEVKDGMYLIGSRGGQVNTGEGIFQFNAEKGYLIKNGELTGLLRDVSLSGKTLEILNHVTLVGNDLKMTAGRCGKAGQLVPVSDGSPHIAISKALVGGA